MLMVTVTAGHSTLPRPLTVSLYPGFPIENARLVAPAANASARLLPDASRGRLQLVLDRLEAGVTERYEIRAR